MFRHVLIENNFLKRRVVAFYDCVYTKTDSSDFNGRVSSAIRTLKNRYVDRSDSDLFRAKNYIRAIATTGLKALISREKIVNPLIVCVPRSKADFSERQLFFRKAISEAARNVGATDGVYYIMRTVNTKTTHLVKTRLGDLGGDGELPYPGITNDTCRLDGDVRGKNIILVDDVYTKNVNIDEDCCQFLLDNGANSVILYTICKTQLES